MGVVAPAKPDRSEAAEWVRANLPECSAFAAAVRAEFSESRLAHASEAGHDIGKPFVPAFSVSGDALMESLRKKVVAK